MRVAAHATAALYVLSAVEQIREYGIQRDRRSAIAEIADIADLTGRDERRC